MFWFLLEWRFTKLQSYNVVSKLQSYNVTKLQCCFKDFHFGFFLLYAMRIHVAMFYLRICLILTVNHASLQWVGGVLFKLLVTVYLLKL